MKEFRLVITADVKEDLRRYLLYQEQIQKSSGNQECQR